MTAKCPHCGARQPLRITWREVAHDDGTGRAVIAMRVPETLHHCPKEAPK